MKDRWVMPAVCAAMALGLCFVSNTITFDHRTDVINQQIALLEGHGWLYDGKEEHLPMFQNRLLFPALMVGFEKLTPFAIGESYLLVRLVTAFACLWVFAWTARQLSPQLSFRDRLLSLMLLFYTLIFTFNFPPGEGPSDFPDAMFTALFALAAFKRRYGVLAALSLIAAFNRESAAFSGVIWVFANLRLSEGRLHQLRTLLEGGILSMATYAAVLSIRHIFSDHAILPHQQQLVTALPHLIALVKQFLAHPTPSGWPLLLGACLVPFAVVFTKFSALDDTEKRLLYAAVTLAAISLVFGLINELRVFIPSLILVNLAATHRLARHETTTSPA